MRTLIEQLQAGIAVDPAALEEAVGRLRKLRLYHWREVVRNRVLSQRHAQHATTTVGQQRKTHRGLARNYQRIADKHLSTVQALNDFVPGTADEDHRNETNQ